VLQDALTPDYVVQSVIVMGPEQDRQRIIDHLKGSMLPSASLHLSPG
jgi:hypothetical protein